MTNGSIVGKVVCETRFSLCFGSQRRKSAPETRFLWPFMLNMMEIKGKRVWRGYFAVQTRLEKMQVPKSVRKARSSPENERENELITRKTKLSQEIDCEVKSRSKVRMQRETDQKTAESIKRSKMAPQDRVRQRTNRNQ